jgi:phospholipid-binding lipoprotein MlaA
VGRPPGPAPRRAAATVWALAALVLSSACGTTPLEHERAAAEPPTRSVGEHVSLERDYVIDVYDPFESFNRGMWRFNAGFDEAVFLPVVRLYEALVPDPLETAVSNFFSNIYEFTTFSNALAQGKFTAAVETAGRFVFNSTFGLAGFVDIATPLGIAKRNEDFGQTLGFYGVGEGPYLVLPLLGPSNLRDALGLAVDSVAFSQLDLLNFDENSDLEVGFYVGYAIDKRRNLPFRYYQTGSPFEYELIRLLYTEKRRLDVKR